MQSQPATAENSLHTRWLVLGACVVLFALVLRASWVTEDAYITLRTVDNFVHGYGLRWNVSERVQSYTHPLWMFVLTVFYFVTREAFATTVFAGILTTAGAVYMLLKCARSHGHALLVLSFLCLSRSFQQFSTSGLENPLTHLLLATFAYLYVTRASRNLRALSCVAALLALNRVDAMVVLAPALAELSWSSLRTHKLKATLRELAIGFSPLLAWELFSLFYYGFLVPNTAYAKLNHGIDQHDLTVQGIIYLLSALAWDPPTFAATAFGLAAAFARRQSRQLMLALGLLLYMFYVVRVGGDFMLGRFWTIPFFTAVCLTAVSELPFERPQLLLAQALPTALLLFVPSATEPYPVGDLAFPAGIADERAFFRGSRLLMLNRMQNLPDYGWVYEGQIARGKGPDTVVHPNVGYFGYYAGPKVHIVDPLALSDPLLARLPAYYDLGWRVGHFRRTVPEGYIDTFKAAECRMSDHRLCEYWSLLHEIVSGSPWSLHRLGVIAKMNLGGYQSLIDRDRYRYPDLMHRRIDELAGYVPPGTPAGQPPSTKLEEDGVLVRLSELSSARRMSMSVDGNDEYAVEFRHGERIVATAIAPDAYRAGMFVRWVDVPEDAREEGYDSLLIRPTRGDGTFGVGYVRLLP